MQKNEINDAVKFSSEIQTNKSSFFEFVPIPIVQGIFFILPVFVLPFGVFVLDFNKAMLFYLCVSVAFLCFFLSRLKKGSIIIPQSFLLASLFIIAGVWFLSTVFSNDKTISLWGMGYETGTFVFFLFLAIVAYLISVLFRSEKQILLSFILFFASAFVVFLVQVLHTGFGLPVPPWAMFEDRLANLVGSWNDMGIFFGLTMILSLTFLEFVDSINIVKRERLFLWGVFALSFTGVFFVNFSTLWFVLGFLAFALWAYGNANRPSSVEKPVSVLQKFMRPSFVVFAVIVIVSFAQGVIKNKITDWGLEYVQVYPSFGQTLDVVKESLQAHPFVGSGPNTFVYDWLLFKPDNVASTIFWDTRFQSGSGRAVSMIAETGLLGGVALVLLFVALFYAGKKAFSYRRYDIKLILLASSFFGSVYLWAFVVFYSPGFLIFALAGIFTGLFVASLSLAGKISLVEISFVSAKMKKRTIVQLASFLFILVAAYGIYAFLAKYLAGYFYTSAMQEISNGNDLGKADKYLKRAVFLDPQDVYFRNSAEVGVLMLQQSQEKTVTVPGTSGSEDEKILAETVQSAKNAVGVNPLDPLNWMTLGGIYERLLPLGANEMKGFAIASYQEAARRSPYDPNPLVALARVELQSKNPEEALKYLEQSIKIKSNFVPSYLILAQVDVEAGRLKDAISKLEVAVVSAPGNPNNPYILLRIAILYFQDGNYEKAKNILEKLVDVNPNYVYARYALGLLYDSNGMSVMAIEQFEELNKLIPGNEEIQKILGNLKAGKGALGQGLTPVAPLDKPKK